MKAAIWCKKQNKKKTNNNKNNIRSRMVSKPALPPPCIWQRYGKRHTFPSPTAYDTHARRNSLGLSQFSLASLAMAASSCRIYEKMRRGMMNSSIGARAISGVKPWASSGCLVGVFDSVGWSAGRRRFFFSFPPFPAPSLSLSIYLFVTI